uniref:Very high density protein 1 n=1 Tax=Odontomachus monticola TaxID=613454 RepID=A0A348G627_ODOMO
MNVLNVLLLCLTAACAVPVHFPAGKTVIYKYYADVKAGVIEPAQYASQFALNGQLHIKKDVSDPALRNAYYVKLQDVKYGMYNGMSAHHQPIEVVHELGEAAQQIQDPFLVVYDRSGKFQGIKVPETESGWSRNIKQGIASMLQLDLSHVQLETPIKPHAFVTTENTIHGTCHVAYDVQPKVPVHPETTNFVVTKLHDLMNCSHFVQRVFDHTECEKCHVEPVDDMTTAARRVFHIEKQDAGILIKHMIAHSVINYFPYNARSEAHYLLTNTTLTLDNVVSTTETHLPVVNFQSIPLVRDVTFNKPVGNYAIHAAEDLTHGRHIVKLDALIPKLKKMLAEAADYLEENHLEAKEPDWKHGQTINRLQHTMSYMDLGSLEQVFTAIQDPKTPKEVTMKNIFLQMIPTVGTTAACHFTRNVVRKHKVTDMTAMTMLAKLPRHVKVPSERLLLEMEDLLKLDNVVSSQVYKASILCFSTLIHRTFMNQSGESVNPLLNRYLHRFFDHVMREPYDMKIVYLMAIKNVQVGNIEKLLEPIIRGEVTVSEHPHHTRVQAIWAIKKAVADKIEYTHNLLWPILADVTQPLPIRIVAYDVLMSQMPNTQRMMSIYWLMVYEQNNHLYNYHLTTLKGLANSVNPCLTPIREMARKFMRYTRIRPITTQLSSKVFFEYIDSLYDHGYSWTSSSVLDEVTGLPHAGYAELHTTVARKVVDRFGIYWNAFGMDEIMKIVKKELMGIKIENLTNKNVLNILSRAALDMPKKNAIHVDICITQHGHVIFAGHYDQTHITKLPEELLPFMKQTFLNYQEITYHTLYEMQVPTDMGLQAVLGTRMPHMLSLRYNDLTDVNSPSPNHKFEFDLRLWRHGEYAMSIYNPIADVWHSIRRSTTRDIAWPLEMNVGFNHEAKSLKINIPRLPVTKLSYSGIRHHAKNLVTITEDEQDVLKECCSTCHHHTVVTTGEKKNYHSAVDSKDTGLKYSTSIFDCDSNVTPVTNAEEWQRAFSPEYKSTWNSKIIQYYMGFIQKLENDYISPEMGSCGRLIKMEPSIIYPTSHVDLTLRVNMDDVDRVNDKMHILSGKKINIRGTLDAKAASTNESVRSWDVNVNMDMSQGHLVNNIRVQVTRVTPGEKKLKICVDVQKNYSETEFPYPKMSNSKVETNTKMTISSGFTDEEKCVRDEMLITMTLKGEMTEQQKSEMAHDHVHGACVKDIANSLFIEKENHVPKTMNCIRETMLYTTLRKYTVNVSYKKIPVSVYSQLSMFDDHFRATHLPHVRYLSERAEGGNAKIVIEFPSDLKYINATVITPVNGYEYIEIPVHQHLFEGMIMGKPTPHWGWHATMDNTHFPISALSKVTQGLTKICTVYPQVLITLDNGVIPFMVPDQWTLVSGDHVDQTYAIFAKAVQGNMIAVKVYIAGHEMEIMPTGSNHVVTVDGNVIVQHEKGVIVPEDEPKFYAFKLAMHNEHLVIHSQRVPVMVLWAPNSVSVMVETVLQGHVTGVCGHMDDMHKERLPKIYSVEHL